MNCFFAMNLRRQASLLIQSTLIFYDNLPKAWMQMNLKTHSRLYILLYVLIFLSTISLLVVKFALIHPYFV